MTDVSVSADRKLVASASKVLVQEVEKNQKKCNVKPDVELMSDIYYPAAV